MQQSQQPCASHRKRIRRGSGGSLPSCAGVSLVCRRCSGVDAHLVVEDLGLARLGLRDEGVVEDVEDILADLLKLGLDLLAVVADGADVLLRALGLLLLLDRGDDAPRGTSCSDDVLVGDGKEVALVNGELVAGSARRLTIVTLSLFAQPGEESLAIATSITGGRWKQQLSRTSHAVWR